MRHLGFSVLAAVALAGTAITTGASAALAAPPHAQAADRISTSLTILYVAQVEGVTVRVLAQDLEQGQTLLQIAGNKYSAADLATALLAPAKTRLDSAVTAGTITASQETLIYGTLLTRAATLVVTPHPVIATLQSDATKIHAIVTTAVTAAAASCHTTPAALTTILRAGGTSMLGACQQTNAAETAAALTAVLAAPAQARLQAAMQAGLLTSAQEAKLSARLMTAIGRAITTTIPAR